MSLTRLTGVAERAGDELTGAAAELARLLPAAEALSGGGPGRVGELVTAMHAQLGAAIAARAREAAAHGARFAEAAQALRLVVAGYAETEEAAHRRHREGEP
jgi:hypothetical protein